MPNERQYNIFFVDVNSQPFTIKNERLDEAARKMMEAAHTLNNESDISVTIIQRLRNDPESVEGIKYTTLKHVKNEAITPDRIVLNKSLFYQDISELRKLYPFAEIFFWNHVDIETFHKSYEGHGLILESKIISKIIFNSQSELANLKPIIFNTSEEVISEHKNKLHWRNLLNISRADTHLRKIKLEKSAEPPHKVFCTSFHKCATTSVGDFLDLIGYRVADHSVFEPCTTGFAHDAMTGNYDKMLKFAEQYNAFDDSPWFSFYKMFDRRYDAKFIHTIRDPESWYRSSVRYFGNHVPTYWDHFIHGKKYASPIGNKRVWLETYLRHNADVLEHFRGRNNFLLLDIFNDADVSDKISDFLGVDHGASEFPHRNKTK